MLLQSLRAPYLAPGGPGSIWNYMGVPVWSTGVSRKFACGFRTDLHFADASMIQPQSQITQLACSGYGCPPDSLSGNPPFSYCVVHSHDPCYCRFPSSEVCLLIV